MVIIQKSTGQLQFHAQAGVFNYPVVGVPYTSTPNTINDFGALPIAYLKYAPTSNLSFEIGKLPALLGAESNFTYQNINIQRGLLFNVEPGVSRGIQANYSTGPFSASISWNDGYYSNRFNWITGLFSYAINGANTLSLYAGGNVGHTGNLGVGNYSTDSHVNSSLAADNSDIYGLIYEYSSGSWMIEPYLQYMHTPANAAAGITSGSSNYGGALLADYSFTNSISLAGRVEYIAATGTPGDGGVSGADILGYGNGSHAWTITVTPTYQDGGFFARAELSYVDVSNYTAAFGANGTNGTQFRGLVETGFMF
ncbi:outer membrane beta-barrel protein [Acidithiobacillus sulfuriphilus]|uniref:Outer membrane beta-barrel protein n=1 Tax=Acidithiobacillus sulfuriphilus TaxID=1867749 RepID=A0ACD5HRN5_9PROT|nr:outer membrane beta-barrel protein [Acidithiobacillus sulfuriphilus]